MVPSGWNTCALEEIALVERGKFSARPRNDPKYFGGDVPFVQTGDVSAAGTFLRSFSQSLNPLGLSVSKTFPKNTILLTIAANIGETTILTFEVACPDSIVGIQAKPEKAQFFWLKMILETYKGRLNLRATQNAQKNINLQTLRPLPIKTPPLAEQSRIADILSTWGEAIEITKKLIENSKAQKKVLMQQLLTGKKRLPGFSDEWSEIVLKNIATVLVSPVNKKSVVGEPSVRLCNYTDVYYNSYITNGLDFMTATASNSEVERFTLKKNDLVITKDSETPGDIAVPALVTKVLDNIVCGYHLAIIRPDVEVSDGAFLNHLFSQSKVRHYFSTRANGATRFGLTIDGIKEASFMLPGIDEQQKIANVLDTCNQELHSLDIVAQKLMIEKRALMQQLLTGKRRVKVAP